MTLDAEQVVYDAGGRMVVLRPAGKIPAWRGYLTNRRPSPSTVGDCLLAGCGVGIVPGSIRSAVLDLDGGQDPAALWREAGEGWLRLPTHRGEHRYFDATGQVTKLPWAAFGCYGDLVEASGYVMLHRDGLQVLAEALPHRKAAPLGQLDLFLNSSRRERFRKAEVDTVRVVVPPGTILEEVPRGARWNALWDAVRFWAYPQSMGDARDAWMARVRDFAEASNARLPCPMGTHPRDDAKDRKAVGLLTALIGGWTWDNMSGGGSRYDHTPEAQRRRGLKRWHDRGGEDVVAAVRNRNRIMVEEALAGSSTREIAGRYGLGDHKNVRSVLWEHGLRWDRGSRNWRKLGGA